MQDLCIGDGPNTHRRSRVHLLGPSPLLFSTWLLPLWVYLTTTPRWLESPLHTYPFCSWASSLPRISNFTSHFIKNCSCKAWTKLIRIKPYTLLYCYCRADGGGRWRALHPNRLALSSSHSFSTYFLSAYHVVQKPDTFLVLTELIFQGGQFHCDTNESLTRQRITERTLPSRQSPVQILTLPLLDLGQINKLIRWSVFWRLK